jgi:4-alpha-glucanotransferase
MLLLEQRIPNGDGSEETEPELWKENYAAYTGTHDSPTIKQWLDNANTTQLNAFNEYSNNLIEKFSEDVWNFISLIWSTPSVLAITTVQDLLQLGSEARFNVPGTEIGNWKWRLSSLDLLKDPLNKISKLNDIYNRSNS